MNRRCLSESTFKVMAAFCFRVGRRFEIGGQVELERMSFWHALIAGIDSCWFRF
jgi:hypothetical protein